MTHSRALCRALAAVVMLAGVAPGLGAQYFGRNKVQYDHFKFDIFRTPHFDVHYYAEERLAAQDAARMLERWNTRLAGLFNHPLSERKPIILYADQPDFQQTNVIAEQLDEGTGGVTESLLNRMVLPLAGSYWESDHVLGHELVHEFQYDIAQNSRGGIGGAMDRLPSWLIEGMAEYLSLGPEDAHTAMWLRDALRRNDLPTIKQLTNSRKYFPYRYGQALWAYIGGTWGDEVIPRIYRASLQSGFDEGIRRVLGLSTDSLSARWRASIRATYTPLLAGRSAPKETGDRVIGTGDLGEYNLSPAVSPDGKWVAYFSSRSYRGITLVVADAATGQKHATLASPGLNSHFDALSFLYSSGSWSPDSRKLAFITYANGNNEIDIADVESKKVERHIRPQYATAITTVAWSPDGRQLAFSGMSGGLADLYLFDLASGNTRRLTMDRFADLQPAWSPDGKTIAFVTDRPLSGATATDGTEHAATENAGSDTSGTDFEHLRYGKLRIGLFDLASGTIRVVPGIAGAQHVNPQFSPDGRSLYVVSDRDGFTDIYRIVIASGEVFQVTHAATGVSGVTASSPALSVARSTGRVLFSVFDNAGFQIAALPAERAQGERIGQVGVNGVKGATPFAPLAVVAPVTPSTPLSPSTPPAPSSAAVLPSDGRGGASAVTNYLHDVDTGLPADTNYSSRAYHPQFRLAAIGQPSLAVSVGGGLGTQIGGSASAYFTDVLGDHSLGVAAIANGGVRDVGGQILYINSARRWNWGINLGRTPYVLGYGAYTTSGIEYQLYHIAVDEASLIGQYPLSATRRLELSGGYTHYGYRIQDVQQSYTGSTSSTDLAAPTPLGLKSATAAYVGDDASMGYTSPIAGTRYRIEVSPTIGSLAYNTLLVDYRRYFLLQPLTLAVRGLHYGRYGRDADSDRLGYLYLGDNSLVRGYSYTSFDATDCGNNTVTCPAFSRLVGSRLALANAELRIPLVGAGGLGLLQSSALPPIEIAPFVDAGVAWTGSESPVWSFTANSAARTPVMSTGITSRVNLFGFAVVEVYYAHPFQRPAKSGVWGFALQPGW